MTIPERHYTWSRLDLFRFSAATGNAHRIHYDVEHARSEGLEGVVVHTTLHAMMLWQTLTAEVDEQAIRGFSWRNHAPLVAGREVVVTASCERAADGWAVTLLECTTDDATTICSGQATVVGTGAEGRRVAEG